jgi:hypothetical protein
LTSFRLQQDIDSIKRQLEQAKLRLITDIRVSETLFSKKFWQILSFIFFQLEKLRNQAEIEIKALQTESNETKSNLSHIKRQIVMDSSEIMV